MQVPNLACILCWSRRVASPLDGSGLEEQISCHVRKEPQEIVVNVLKGVRETIISSFCGSKCSESYQSSAAANVQSLTNLLRQQMFGVFCGSKGSESYRRVPIHVLLWDMNHNGKHGRIVQVNVNSTSWHQLQKEPFCKERNRRSSPEDAPMI